MIKDITKKTALDIAIGPLRRLLLKNCGKAKAASPAAVAAADQAAAELLAELEAAPPPKKEGKGATVALANCTRWQLDSPVGSTSTEIRSAILVQMGTLTPFSQDWLGRWRRWGGCASRVPIARWFNRNNYATWLTAAGQEQEISCGVYSE